jgi:hypothetical protein
MPTKTIYLKRSNKIGKKYMVRVDNRTIHFGAINYSDYTKHKDIKRKVNYIKRHKVNENWNKSGIKTAGFWSRWLLWNKPTIRDSIKNIENKFNVKIKRSWPSK